MRGKTARAHRFAARNAARAHRFVTGNAARAHRFAAGNTARAHRFAAGNAAWAHRFVMEKAAKEHRGRGLRGRPRGNAALPLANDKAQFDQMCQRLARDGLKLSLFLTPEGDAVRVGGRPRGNTALARGISRGDTASLRETPRTDTALPAHETCPREYYPRIALPVESYPLKSPSTIRHGRISPHPFALADS